MERFELKVWLSMPKGLWRYAKLRSSRSRRSVDFLRSRAVTYVTVVLRLYAPTLLYVGTRLHVLKGKAVLYSTVKRE